MFSVKLFPEFLQSLIYFIRYLLWDADLKLFIYCACAWYFKTIMNGVSVDECKLTALLLMSFYYI